MTEPIYKRSPAHEVIEQLGGNGVVSEALGVHRSQLTRWRMTGQIPISHFRNLLALARHRGVKLNIGDLIVIED